MSARQFMLSLDTIRRTRHTNRAAALGRHLYWQARKLMFSRPVRLALSNSVIEDSEPGGVISMVNMLGRYDYNNMNLVQLVLALPPATLPGVFLDVGANIGSYTLIASENPEVHVISLEPIPAAYEKLRHNVALNRRKNVDALNLGASDHAGLLCMTADSASCYNQVIDGEHQGPAAWVQMDTLDAICARLQRAPTMLKVDVEGHEPQVLAGAPQVLGSCLACLIENGGRPDIVEVMHARGLSGPFYYHHRDAALGRTPQPVPEDSVYIGPRFSECFPHVAIEPRRPGA